MKKKFNIWVIYMASIFLCTNISMSQSLSWETAIPVSLSINTFSNQSVAMKTAYDNYGLHIVARNYANGKLNYYLFGNKGELLQQITDFAETEIFGFDLISHQGNVYVITIKNTTFKVYKKINSLTSNLQLVTQSTPSDYSTGLQGFNDLIETDITESNGRLYFVWDDAGYFPTSGQSGDIGILSYNISSNSLFFSGSIENSQSFPNYAGGESPSLAVNGSDIYFSYTWPTPNPPNPLEKFFVFRKGQVSGDVISFPNSSEYYPSPIGAWGSPSFGTGYIIAEPTRTNLIYEDGKIILAANLNSNFNAVDYKYKISSSSSISWSTTADFVWGDVLNIYTPPQLLDNEIDNKIDFPFSKVEQGFPTNTFYSQIRGLNLSNNTLGSEATLFSNTEINPVSVLGAQGLKGMILFSSSNFDELLIRRPNVITTDINYDMLLTGNEYFDAASSPWIHSNGADITGKPNSIMHLYPNTRIFIDQGDILSFEGNACIDFGQNSEIINNGGTINSLPQCMQFDEWACIATDQGGLTKFSDNGQYLFDNGGFMVVRDNSTLELGNNTTITFDGVGSFLQLDANSNIILGSNSKLIFKNGAHIKASYVDFECSSIWDGIYLENQGDATHWSSITNCTFSNAKIPIKIYNNNSSSANNLIEIKNNTIEVPYNGSYGIYADNVTNILIQDNIFDDDDNNPKPSIYIKNPENVGDGDGLPGGNPVYSMNIIHNTFNNTGHGMILAGYTSALVPYYISNNQGSVKGYGLIGRRIDGGIKDNNITSSGNRNFLLHQSSPDLSNNYIKSTHTSGTGLVLLSEASPKLAPVVDQGDFVWVAGNNHIEGNTFSVQFNYINSILLNYGQNVFKIASGSTNKHLYGPYNNATTILKASNNCWEPSGIEYEVWGTAGAVYVNAINSPGYLCRQITPTGTIITDMGNGIYDTTYIAQADLIETSSEDEILYGEAITEMQNTAYYDAIAAFKGLIMDFPSSGLTITCLSDLYFCHESLDTFSVQADRSIHYGALKTFLEDRITSGLYDSKFDEDAYNYILMCQGNMGEFDEAVSGYEFLSLYHPDPETRLMSSEDLAIVESLMEGEGSGNNNLTAEQNLFKTRKKVDKLVSGDPVMRKVKSSFDKIREENTKNLEKDLNSKFGREKADVKLLKIKQIDAKFDNRVMENMSLMRNLTSEEKEQRHLETIMIIAGTDRNEIISDSPINSNPYHYSLSQNYPNPFNPSTTINYSIPNDLIVKIKVYDIAGREVSTLVNELKTAGNYTVSFNGNGMASGVYFYTINAGSFVETKRMVLVK